MKWRLTLFLPLVVVVGTGCDRIHSPPPPARGDDGWLDRPVPPGVRAPRAWPQPRTEYVYVEPPWRAYVDARAAGWVRAALRLPAGDAVVLTGRVAASYEPARDETTLAATGYTASAGGTPSGRGFCLTWTRAGRTADPAADWGEPAVTTYVE